MNGDTSAGTPGPATAQASRGLWRGLPGRLRRWRQDGLLRQLFRNAGVLLTGSAVGGLIGLAALALAARSLGTAEFGLLVLVHTYALTAGRLVKFESWQAVVRYGAACLEGGRREDFQGLVKFTVLLDTGTALFGMLLAIGLAPWVGPLIGWPEDLVPVGMVYCSLILLTVSATPNGILRLFDRFDLLAVEQTVTPVARLIGGIWAFSTDAGLLAWLAVWYVGNVAGGLALAGFGLREFVRQDMHRGMNASFRRLARPHRSLWKFALNTNILGSLTQVSGRVATLVTGAVLGPEGAGLFKIAQQFATGLLYPPAMLKRALFPELARLWQRGQAADMRRVILRAGFIAGSLTAIAIPVLWFFGEWMIGLVVGPAYLAAWGLVVLVGVEMTIRAFGFPLDSTMIATGRPGLVLRIRALLTVGYLPLLVGMLWWTGLIGAGIAAVANALLWAVLMSGCVVRRLRARPAVPATSTTSPTP